MIDFGFFALAVLRADRLWKSGFLLNVLLKVRVPLGEPESQTERTPGLHTGGFVVWGRDL